MKLCLLFLLISLTAFAGVDLSCSQYEAMAPAFEKKLMNKSAQDCSSLSVQSLMGSTDDSLKSNVEKYRCNELSLIEADLKRLQSELDLLQGFQKLKADIKAEKEKLGSTVLISAQTAGKNFTDGVITAQSMELLFSDQLSPDFLKSLKEKLANLPEKDRSDPGIFINKVKSLCPSKIVTQVSACHSSFKPTSEAVKEINEFLKKGDPTAESIKAWKEALSIKKVDGGDYSFAQMYEDLKDALPKLEAEDLLLTKAELKALQNLPDFEDASKLGSLAALKANRKSFKLQELMEEAKFLNGDLKARSQFEIQNKVSLAWSNIAADITLSAEEKTACDSAHKTYEQAALCLKAFKKALPNTSANSAKNYLEKLDESLRATQSHMDLLTKVENECLNSTLLKQVRNKGVFSSECEALLPDVDSELAKKQKEVLVLNALKNQIGKENDRLMTFRNYVIEKLAKNNCAIAANASIDFCPTDLTLNSAREALVLSSDVMKIALVHDDLKRETDILEYCDEDKLLSDESRLCDSEDADEDKEEVKVPVEVKLPETKESAAQLDTTRNGSGETSTAWRQGLVGLGTTLAGGLFGNQNQYGYNPYMYNFSAYPSFGYGSPNLGNSWLQMNAQHYGSFGYYQPAGTPAYTAFPIYNSYFSAPQSSYFSGLSPIR